MVVPKLTSGTSTYQIGWKDAKISIKPAQVSKVISTHLHTDHTDMLNFFPTNEIIVNALEDRHPYENLPTTYSAWFKLTLTNLSRNRVDYFNDAHAITKSENTLLVSTPGHTHHHYSVLLKTNNEHILFVGDTSYKQQQLLDDTHAESNIDYTETQEMYDIIKQYASTYPTLYLPSYDKDSGKRLAAKETVNLTITTSIKYSIIKKISI